MKSIKRFLSPVVGLGLLLSLGACATPLGSAIEKGDNAAVKTLLDRGASAYASTWTGGCGRFGCNTALHQAAYYNNIEALRLFLERGANPNIRRARASVSDSDTPLCTASYYGRTESAKLLLDYGADPSLSCEGQTALKYAREKNHPEIVQLIQAGMEKWEKKKALKELKARMDARRKAMRTVDLMKSNQEETAGDSAMAGGKPGEALSHYISALLSAHPEGDQKLRKKIINLVVSTGQRPSMPDKVQEHSDRAQSFMKRAQGTEGYEQAIAELEAALLIAPWWGEAYFNLGLLLEKVGDYEGAVGSLRLYLLSAPDAKDAGAVKKKIIDIEVAKEMAKGR